MPIIKQTIIDAIRYGLPATGAVLGAVVAGKKGKAPTLPKLGLYTLGGWVAGYAARLVLLEGIGGAFHKPLPQTVAAINSAPPSATPEASMPPSSGTNNVKSQESPSTDAVAAVKGTQGSNVSVKGTLFSDAYGAL
jgi:hypothetical protein